jgi:tetratricopeptide (TPR) repeat protein
MTVKLFPDSIHGYFVFGWVAWRRHKIGEAVAAIEKALSLSREAFALAFLGHVYGRIGRRKDSELLLRELDQLFAQGQTPPVAFAILHAGIGNVDVAFDWLERACRLRDDKIFWLPLFDAFDPLRPDPRFAALIDLIPSID